MDPLSIAAGAAGFIALGVTACDNLVAYCRNSQSRDSDILHLEQHAEGLQAVVRGLERRMCRPSGSFTADTSLADSIQQCLDACDMCILDFKILRRKYSTAEDPRNHGKSVMRQTLYPFQKDQFESLRAQMLEFHSALLTYLLLLLNLYLKLRGPIVESRILTFVHSDHTSELHRSSLASKNPNSTTLSQTLDLSNQISAMVPGMTQTLDSRLARLDHSIQVRLESLERTTALALHPYVQSRLSGITTETADDQVINSTKQVVRFPQVSLPEFDCCCSANAFRNSSSRSSSSTLAHEERCRFSYQNRKRHVVIGNLKVFKWLFQFRIGIQYSRRAARDLQIQPNFTIRATVGTNSPAFNIVYQTFWAMEKGATAPELRDALQSCLRTLQGLFLERRAWPTDVTELGENLLHVRNMTSSRGTTRSHTMLTDDRLLLLEAAWNSMRRRQQYFYGT